MNQNQFFKHFIIKLISAVYYCLKHHKQKFDFLFISLPYPNLFSILLCHYLITIKERDIISFSRSLVGWCFIICVLSSWNGNSISRFLLKQCWDQGRVSHSRAIANQVQASVVSIQISHREAPKVVRKLITKNGFIYGVIFYVCVSHGVGRAETDE